MGSSESKPSFHQSLTVLITQLHPLSKENEEFWESLWSQPCDPSAGQLFDEISGADVRRFRRDNPANLATLCFQAVRRLVLASDVGCTTDQEQNCVINCVNFLLRMLPFLLEDAEWRHLLWNSSSSPSQSSSSSSAAAAVEAASCNHQKQQQQQQPVLAEQLLLALSDLLFCPDFTVTSTPLSSSSSPANLCSSSSDHRARGNAPVTEHHEDIRCIDSCEYIWSAGVGFTLEPAQSVFLDHNRTLLLKLLLVCFSETIYLAPAAATAAPISSYTAGVSAEDCSTGDAVNHWLSCFVSSANRHALPLFTSLLNVVLSYDPASALLPYSHVLFEDSQERLVEAALHVLTVCLDHAPGEGGAQTGVGGGAAGTDTSTDSGLFPPQFDETSQSNLFIDYLSRIHREDDFEFILKGFTRLLNNPLQQTYLPHSAKKIGFHQELLVLFWKCCDYNKKLLYYVLKSGSVLQVAVPLLYHAHLCRCLPAQLGLVHIAVFVLLLLSGERNFGVRLNRPYLGAACMDVPVFSGTHADLLIVVFHKIITTGHQRLQSLFHCLLTVLVNVSPYLKTLSMVSATKLLHLLEVFSTPWFLYCSPANHQLVFFLLEMFNNIIQYQFDGNSNLVYTIIRKRHVFHSLANLPTDATTIDKSLQVKRARLLASDILPAIKDRLGTGLLPEPGSLNTTLLTPSGGHQVVDTSSCDHHQGALAAAASVSNGSSSSSTTTDSTLVCLDRETQVSASSDSHPLSDYSPPSTSAAAAGGGGGAAAGGGSGAAAAGGGGGAAAAGGGGSGGTEWRATPRWLLGWKNQLPLQTIMRLLQVLVPQVEKICIDKGLTDESEILRFLQHGTLVGLLPVPHPILVRKYQTNSDTVHWFRAYLWGVIYLRSVDPPVWLDTDVKLFEVQKH